MPLTALSDHKVFIESLLMPNKYVDLARRAGSARQHNISLDLDFASLEKLLDQLLESSPIAY